MVCANNYQSTFTFSSDNGPINVLTSSIVITFTPALSPEAFDSNNALTSSNCGVFSTTLVLAKNFLFLLNVQTPAPIPIPAPIRANAAFERNDDEFCVV